MTFTCLFRPLKRLLMARFRQRKKVTLRAIATKADQEYEDHSQEVYDEALKRGSVTVNRSRVIVAGQDGAGKSCLVDSLLDRPFEKDKASTEGAAVAMIYTATCGWVATDSKDHLDPLIAEGVYRMKQQQFLSKSSHEVFSEPYRVAIDSKDLDSKSEASISDGTSKAVELASAVKSLEEDLKTVGIKAKTLTAKQQQLVNSFLRSRPSEEDLRKQILGVRDIWDLGGQEIYLATHAALMPDSKAFGLSMYMIVMDISKLLSNKAESFHRTSDGEVIDQTNELGWIRTNGDFPLYWFGSIAAAHGDTPLGDHWLGKDEEVAPPPVFAIGSHRDVLDSDKETFPDPESVQRWLEDQEKYFEELLSHSDFVKHIVVPKKHGVRKDSEDFREMFHFFKRMFLIDNSVSGSASPCKGIAEIRKRVDRMSTTYWNGMKKQPLFWVYLEILLFRWSKVMKTVVAKVDEIVKLAQHPTICNISSREEVLVALKYLANVGAILYYPQVEDLKDVVFTRPMWVIKALSAFVTAAKPGPLMEPKWNILKERGIMSNDLMNYRLKQMRDADVSDLASSLKDAGREQIEDENRLIIRLLELLGVIAPVAESPPFEFYVPSMLKTSFLCSPTHWESHRHSLSLPAPLIVIPMNLKFVPECLYFRLVTRFLNLYPKNPELSRHQCVFQVPDKETPAVEGMQLYLYSHLICMVFLVEIELLYHSRGNWIALTIVYVNEDDVAKANPSFLHSIREELYEQMRSICQQGMGGFKYSICCQIREAVRADGQFDIDVKSLPVLENENSEYLPRDAKLYDKFGKRLRVKSDDFLKIDFWFRCQSSDVKPLASQGKISGARLA